MTGLKRVAVLEAVLLETEQVKAFAVEIAVEFVAMPRKTALVEMMPDRCHRLDMLHMVKLVVDHVVQIFVDGKETDGLLVGQHVITHDVLFLSSGEGMVEECLDIFLLKLLDRHQHLRGVQQHVGTVDGSIDQEVALEGLAQIDSHRDTGFHDVRLIDDGLHRVRGVEQGEGEAVSPDAYGDFPFVHHLALITLATQTANSPAAITASMILISRLLLCISAAKIQNN